MAAEMTAGERMRRRRKELGMSAEFVAKRLGVSPATVYRYENGDIAKLPGRLLRPAANILGLSPSQLMGWDEESAVPEGFQPVPDMERVPLLGSIACGGPILAQENVEGYVDLPEHIRADFALRCQGDSMINARIFDGDIVYIRSQPTVNNGEIAAVLIGEEATLKRVRLFKDHISLEPENPLYRPIVKWGPEMESVRILGKAVAFTGAVK